MTSAVPSALVGLTAGFGMEPGGPPPRKPPTTFCVLHPLGFPTGCFHKLLVFFKYIAVYVAFTSHGALCVPHTLALEAIVVSAPTLTLQGGGGAYQMMRCEALDH